MAIILTTPDFTRFLGDLAGTPITLPVDGNDAELIRLCGDYVRTVAACNDLSGQLDLDDDDPLWAAADALEGWLEGLRAHTLAGVIAEAKVAAFLAKQPDGSEDFSDCCTVEWMRRVVRDLLRLSGKASS